MLKTEYILHDPIVVNFYYYYSYFTLSICLLMTPLLIYIILTQSDGLKSFKWLIINHLFWCLIFECFWCSVKPLFLSPSCGGFPLGIFRNGTFNSTMALTLFGWLLVVNTIGALAITLLSRYLLAFPSALTKWYNLKVGIVFALTIMTATYVIVLVMFSYLFSPEKETILAWAAEYNLEAFVAEPGFTIVPHFYLSKACMFLLVVLPFIGAIFIALLAFFIYLVKSNHTQTVEKLQKSLIISSLAQILCTFIFLILPIFGMVLVWYFKISNSANFICFNNCIIATHTLAEFIATIFFISPYRRFMVKHMKRVWTCKNQILSKINSVIWSAQVAQNG